MTKMWERNIILKYYIYFQGYSFSAVSFLTVEVRIGEIGKRGEKLEKIYFFNSVNTMQIF
jgi:hypothetical protein